MLNRKRKIIVDESDEEVEDSYPNMFGPNNPLCPSRSVGPSYHRDTLKHSCPITTLPSPDLESVGNRSGPASGSVEYRATTHSDLL